MTNLDRITDHIREHGMGSMSIHTLPRGIWLVAQKVGDGRWRITKLNPYRTTIRSQTEVGDGEYEKIREKLLIDRTKRK